MAYVSHEHRFLFLAAPATGSSAVIKALSEGGIGEWYPAEDIRSGDRRITPRKHSTLEELQAGGLLDAVSGYRKAVGVRNVFSWYVAKYLRNRTERLKQVENQNSWINRLPEVERSRYTKNIRRQAAMSFEQFLRHQLQKRSHFDPQSHFHHDIDYYIHQESMDRDFSRLAEDIGLPVRSVPPFNVTGAMKDGQSYRDFYTAPLVNLVFSKCSLFFERFPEYDFDGLRD